jgi:hypothetical protein
MTVMFRSHLKDAVVFDPQGGINQVGLWIKLLYQQEVEYIPSIMYDLQIDSPMLQEAAFVWT